MGLAQLHQLRGRVGRGARASTCVLLYSQPLGAIARERLNIIKNSQDGFEIARHDLRLRGPGERLGAKQSGAHLLRFADIEADSGLLQQASDIATVMLDTQPDAVERHLARWLSGGVERLNA
jgi:ATP-dependent DNA helicase RecG